MDYYHVSVKYLLMMLKIAHWDESSVSLILVRWAIFIYRFVQSDLMHSLYQNVEIVKQIWEKTAKCYKKQFIFTFVTIYSK